jgi:hypothetical protein
MMLRESIAAIPDDIRAADDGAQVRRAVLESFVDGVTGDDPAAARRARQQLADAHGHDWLVDAAAVVANFEMMTRLADGTGARLTAARLESTAAMRAELGIDRLPSRRS